MLRRKKLIERAYLPGRAIAGLGGVMRGRGWPLLGHSAARPRLGTGRGTHPPAPEYVRGGTAKLLTVIAWRRLVLDNLAGHKTPEFVCWLMDYGIMPLHSSGFHASTWSRIMAT